MSSVEKHGTPGPEDIGRSSRSYRWVVFALLSLMYLLVFFQRQAPAVLALDLMRDLELESAALGLMSAAFFYPYALLQLPAGAITRKLGPRRTLCGFFALAGLGAVLISLTQGFFAALACRVLVGVGTALILVPILEIIAAWFKRSEFAGMIGLLIGIAGLGVYSGAGPLGMLDHVLGWRGCFLAVGAISLALAGLAWLLVRDSPEQIKFSPPEERATPQENGTQGRAPRPILRVVATPAFWPPAIWAFLSLGIFISFGGLWGGPYLMHVHELDKVQTGHVLGMLALGMIVGGPLLGFLADRVFKSEKITLVLSSALLLALTIRIFLAGDGMSNPELYLWFGLLGLSTMAAAPLALTLVRNAFPRELAGTASGVANFFFLAGGAVMQQMAGHLLGHAGLDSSQGDVEHFSALFTLYLVCAAAALAATLLVKGKGLAAS